MTAHWLLGNGCYGNHLVILTYLVWTWCRDYLPTDGARTWLQNDWRPIGCDPATTSARDNYATAVATGRARGTIWLFAVNRQPHGLCHLCWRRLHALGDTWIQHCRQAPTWLSHAPAIRMHRC